jgi:hypothetical protein
MRRGSEPATSIFPSFETKDSENPSANTAGRYADLIRSSSGTRLRARPPYASGTALDTPDSLQQFFAGHHVAAVRQKVFEEPEFHGRKRYLCRAANRRMAAQIDPYVSRLSDVGLTGEERRSRWITPASCAQATASAT